MRLANVKEKEVRYVNLTMIYSETRSLKMLIYTDSETSCVITSVLLTLHTTLVGEERLIRAP